MNSLSGITQMKYSAWINKVTPVTPPPATGEQTIFYTEDLLTDFPNPERGWYTEPAPGSFGSLSCAAYDSTFPVWNLPDFDDTPTLNLYFVRLDAYRDTVPLPSSLIDSIKSNLDQARTSGVKVVLRFGYNRSSSGEDTDVTTMTSHIEQIGAEILADYSDVIAVLQGGFIGRWGEMDSLALNSDSPGKTQSGRNAILNALLDNTPPEMMVQFRDPAYYQMDSANYPTALTSAQRFTGTKQARAGHYNDCFLAGYPMVTYWNGDNGYTTEQQIQYAKDIGDYTAMGGETCDEEGLNEFNSFTYSRDMMADMAWDYLNCGYWTTMYQSWDSNLAEISRRMGYRLVMDEATFPTNVSANGNATVSFGIRNVGFGKVYNPRPIDLIFVGSTGTHTVRLTSDARLDLPLGGQTATLSYDFAVPSAIQEDVSYSLYLAFPDPSPNLEGDVRYSIRMANTGIWNAANGRHDLNVTVTGGTSSTPVLDTDFSLLGDPAFDRLALANDDKDANGMGLRDWYDALYAGATSGYYDLDYNSPDNRPGNREGSMYIHAILMGLRMTGDLRLLDEAIRLTELWYSNLATDGGGWLYLPDTNGEDQGLDTNMQAGVFAKVMYAAHVNRGLTSPGAYNYGTIADKYKDYITDNFFPRELNREGAYYNSHDGNVVQSPNGIVHDYVGWRHDGGAIANILWGVVQMGGGGTWTLSEWESELDWFLGVYFSSDASCPDGDGGRTTLVMPFTLVPENSTNPDSYSLIYTTYVRYMIAHTFDLWLEEVDPTKIDFTWFKNLSHSMADFVLDTTFTTDELARTLGGDNPPGDERCGVPYNGTYRARITSADDRWQNSSYSMLEGFDSRGRIHDYGVQAYASSGVYANEFPIYAAARIFTYLYFGDWNPKGVVSGGPGPGTPPVDNLLGAGSDSDSETTYPRTGPVTDGDWYVDINIGNDGNVGNTVFSPLRTINAARAKASDGQTILVRAGTYPQTSTISSPVSWTTGLNIYNYGEERPVIDCSSHSSYGMNLTGANEHWKGFRLQNTGSYGIRITGPNYFIEDFEVRNTFREGIYILGSGADSVKVQDCVVWRIGLYGAGTDRADAMACTTGGGGEVTQNHRIVRSLFANGVDDCVDLFLARNTQVIDSVAYGGGFHFSVDNTGGDGNGFKLGGAKTGSTGGGNTLRGCLAIHNRVCGITVNGADPELSILRNTAANNPRGFILDHTATNPHVATDNIAVDNLTYYNASIEEPLTDTYNTWNLGIAPANNPSDPGGQADFADPANYDWSLLTGSPCLGVSSTSGNLGASSIALALAKEKLPMILADTGA